MPANDNTNCSCSGPICSCGALGVVKDGAGVRVPAHMMDSATGNLTVDGLTIDRATWDAYMVSPEIAYDKSKHQVSHQHMGDRAPAFDAAAAGRFLADRIRQGKHLQDNIERMNRAADPTKYNRDGVALADLNPSQLAYHHMLQGMGRS